jgi:hypothetical protein
MPAVSTAAVNVNTAIANDINITCACGTANAANSISCIDAIMKIY